MDNPVCNGGPDEDTINNMVKTLTEAHEIINKATEKINRHVKIYSPEGSLLEEVKIDRLIICNNDNSVRLFYGDRLVANVPSNYLLLIYIING